MRQALSVRRTLVGSMLRQYREAQAYKLDDAARALECDRSKISRIETGERGIRPRELRELLTEYGVDTDTQDILAAITRTRNLESWRRQYGRVLPDPYLDFIVIAGVASRIMIYAPLQVPELLCTGDYAQALAAADPGVPEDLEESRVQATIDHQQAILFDRQPDVTVIIGEAALRQQVGGRLVMRRQFEHLATLGDEHAWLSIRILPFEVGTYAAGASGAWSVLQFSEIPDLGLIHVAGPGGGICLNDPSATTAYAQVFAQTSLHALDPEQSAQQLRQLAMR